MSRYGAERKATAGQAATFLHVFSDGYPAAAPTLVVQFASGNVSVEMAPVREADTVTAYSSDRRQLTLATGNNAAGLAGLLSDYSGDAWLVGPGVSMPVRAQRIVSDAEAGTVLELAEPLPHHVTHLATTTLRWGLYYAALAADQVGASVQRNVRWRITWTRTQGNAALAQVTTTHGLLHVVRAPFDTGLTDQWLRAYVPDIGRMVPGGQSSFFVQREAAHLELVQWLRVGYEAEAGERGPSLPSTLREDDVTGEWFREVHALLTVARLHEGLAGTGAAEMAARFRTQAQQRYRAAMASIPWGDLDGDGEVDAGETAVAARGISGAFRSHVTDPTVFDDGDLPDPIRFDRVRVGGDR